MNFVGEYPRFMDPAMAETYVGGPTIFADMKTQKLITPRVKKKGCTRYDRVELDLACDVFKPSAPDLDEGED